MTLIKPSEVSRLTNASPDIVRTISLNVPIENLLNLCLSNKYLNSTICDDEKYWKLRYHQDYGDPSYQPSLWRQLYMQKYKSKNIFVMGNNKYGQLGITNGDNYDTPIELNIKAIKVSCGYYHTAVIDDENNLWVTGLNNKGQLGLGDFTNRSTFYRVPDINVLDVACGKHHTLIIDINKNVLGFGSNEHGQLGPVKADIISQPIKITEMKGFQVACGGEHSALINDDDVLYMFGSNSDGQLGVEKLKGNILYHPEVPYAGQVSCGEAHTIFTDLSSGIIYTFGRNLNGQLGYYREDQDFYRIPMASKEIDALDIACGHQHTLATTFDRKLIATGDNKCGQLGVNVETEEFDPEFPREEDLINESFEFLDIKSENQMEVISMSGGECHTVVIDTNNDIWGFGSNDMGQLGFKIIDYPVSTGLQNDSYDYPNKLIGLKGKQVSCGKQHTVIIGYKSI